jgi:hypothetical protein
LTDSLGILITLCAVRNSLSDKIEIVIDLEWFLFLKPPFFWRLPLILALDGTHFLPSRTVASQQFLDVACRRDDSLDLILTRLSRNQT